MARRIEESYAQRLVPGSKPLLQRPYDLAVAIFFFTHIPVTLIIDSQVVLPEGWYPSWATQTLQWYLDNFNDPLCKHRPSWFRALAWSEVIAQLPFFFVGLYGFSFCKEWIRTPALVYGLCTATTLLPILGELILTDNTEFNKGVLLGFYLPYLIMPLSIALRCLSRQQLFLPPTKDVNKWL